MNFSFDLKQISLISACIILLLATVQEGICQHEIDKNRVIQSDTITSKNFQSLIIPIVFYTPETSLGFGVGGQLFFRTKGSAISTRLSNFFGSIFYTLNKQLVIDLKPQIYFRNESYFLDAAFKYKIYPNRFWGIGNTTPESNEESYNMESLEFSVAYLKRLPQQLNFGFEYSFAKYNMLEIKEEGLMDTAKISGSRGATLSGLSVVFTMDSRDNYFSPNKGHYVYIKAGFTSQAMGSTHSFNKYIIDARRYFPVKPKFLLAIQGYFEFNFGETPFQDAAIYGGGERARGYFKGRYIDGHMYVLQAEGRFKIHDRWKLAAFVSTGEVGNNPRNFFEDIKISYGGGIRFQVLKDNPALIRLDIGFTKVGQSGIYFGVNEAF